MNDVKKIPFLAGFFASGFYSGYFPLFPGTVGSALAFIVFLVFNLHNSFFFLPLIIIVFILGTISSSIVEKILGNDPSMVVIDEIVGMWVSLVFLPNNLYIWLAAFVIFRIFDIIKPFPCKQLEKINSGLGIMLDDVMAGIYTNLLLQLTVFIF